MNPNLSRDEFEILRKNKKNIQMGEEYSDIMKAVGNSHVVMIGEASHGTHDFYHHRAEITKKLIKEKGFNIVIVEGDWTDCYRINRYIRGNESRDKSAEECLGDFKRFPRWMWRNTVMLDFVKWLRQNNDKFPEDKNKVGFYGMDFYNWFASMGEVLNYLKKVDPKGFYETSKKYGKFDKFHSQESSYGYATEFGFSPSLEKEVIEVLVELKKKGPEYLKGYGGFIDGDELFFTQMNAELVKNAEEYYRSTYMPRANTWNLRDRHMVETISNLMGHYKSKDIFPKAIVWAHNSHLGDARFTDSGTKRGEWNVGQLVRERFGMDKCFNIGFSSFHGTVTAAKNWNDDARYMQVKNGFFNSFEHVLHSVSEEDYYLVLRSNNPSLQVDQQLVETLSKKRLERFIGVIYASQTERQSHYSRTSLSKEYDAVICIKRSEALRPLDIPKSWEEGERIVSSDKEAFIDPYPELWEELDNLPNRLDACKHLLQLGESVSMKKNYLRARITFRKALSYIMNNYVNDYSKPGVEEMKTEILLHLARSNLHLELWNEVVDCCNKISEYVDLPEVHYLLCNAYIGKSRIDLAERQIKELQRMEPSYATLGILKQKIQEERSKEYQSFKRGFFAAT